MVRRSFIALLLIAGIARAADAPADQIDPLVLSSIDAAQRGDLKPLADEVSPRAAAALADPAKLDLPAVLQIATCREFASYFARLGDISNPNRELLAWMIQQPKFAATLMTAVSPADPPDGVLDALRKLHDDYGDDIAKSPDLTAAFVTVWDSTGDVAEDNAKKVDLDRASRLYGYYAKQSSRFDLHDLPWQLATWVVSNPLSEDEITFARAKYSDRSALASAFFDPPFNDYPGYVMEPKKPTDLAYTLPNILKNGGSTADRAHFAVSIARSLGVPAGVCTATVTEDQQPFAPSWAAVLDVNDRRVRWNFESARFPEHHGWRGTVIDPQTHSPIEDCELAQLAELQAVSPERRLQSAAIVQLLDAADESQRPTLLLKAIELSPGNLPAWQGLTELVKNRKLSDAQADAFTVAIEKYAMPHNGAFAFEMFMAMVKPHGTIQQLALLDRAAKGFSGQPDVLARVKIAQGDAQRDLKQPAAALAAFGEAITLQPKTTPIVLEAFERVDDLFRKNNDLPHLVDAYAAAWPRLDRPRPSHHSRGTPYVMIGKMYIQALQDAGKQREADQIQTAIDNVQLNDD